MKTSKWAINRVVALEYRDGHTFHIAFADGVRGDVDLGELVGCGPVFMQLQDPAFFRSATIDGGTIAWPNGADIAPETLHEMTRQAMTAPNPVPGPRVHRSAKQTAVADTGKNNTRNFAVVMQRCNTSGRYVGYVPGLRGTRSQAGTPDELCAHLREVVATRLQNGEPVPDGEFVEMKQIAVPVA